MDKHVLSLLSSSSPENFTSAEAQTLPQGSWCRLVGALSKSTSVRVWGYLAKFWHSDLLVIRMTSFCS